MRYMRRNFIIKILSALALFLVVAVLDKIGVMNHGDAGTIYPIKTASADAPPPEPEVCTCCGCS